jgi:hypothetical protein
VQPVHGDAVEEGEHAEFAEISGDRDETGKMEFLVRWKGGVEQSWLSSADFDDPAMLTSYFRKKNSSSRKREGGYGKKIDPQLRRSKRRKR